SQYRLIASDMLGFGFSDKPKSHTYSINEQADILESLIQQLGIRRLHVLAHDYGDTVAQEMLARQLEGTGVGEWLSVCFLNGGLFPETHRALFIQKLLLSPLGPLVNALSSKKRFRKALSRTFGPDTQPADDEISAFWHLINYNNGKHLFHNLITYMRERKVYRERWVGALRDCNVPLALINGSVDPVSGAHMIEHYRNTIGELDYLVQLDDIGHYPHVEDPQSVIAAYTSFLNENGATATQ
ncbi:MAG: alpha/beta hydrolase, partial [Pseudomonadota bacterium]